MVLARLKALIISVTVVLARSSLMAGAFIFEDLVFVSEARRKS
jgi:hypothetical protein